MKIDHQNNNFDLIRVFAAILVMYSHVTSIFTPIGFKVPHDPITNFLLINFGQTGQTSGSISVEVFFFISGFLLMGAILRDSSLTKFTLSRCFRLFPALIICAILISYVMGPLITKLPLSEYFASYDVVGGGDK
jgi:peptidoglycan/LPS O-acetylase OafA/YrhL